MMFQFHSFIYQYLLGKLENSCLLCIYLFQKQFRYPLSESLSLANDVHARLDIHEKREEREKGVGKWKPGAQSQSSSISGQTAGQLPRLVRPDTSSLSQAFFMSVIRRQGGKRGVRNTGCLRKTLFCIQRPITQVWI